MRSFDHGYRKTKDGAPRGKIGLLPFYLGLYDDVCPLEQTEAVRAFADVIHGEYVTRGVDVRRSPVCCEKLQFEVAVREFEQAQVDAIVSLHLAYSPSLEAIDAMAGTDVPLIVLDTTPDYAFGFEQEKERIMFNHGIHGVQDLCNLLIRRGKPFAIEAGHWRKSDVLDRTVSRIRGYAAARALHGRRVGLLGAPFKGMGDFAVPFELLKERFGIEIVQARSEDVAGRMPTADAPEVRAESEADLERFDAKACSAAALAESEAAGLALRKWLEDEKLDAFTMNFGDITGAPGLPVVPFLEASKAMARGIGYGGEGDVLTAAFCAALMRAVPETTFTEMFCPDWEGERIFLSHMGEINIDLTAETPVLEQRPYPFSSAGDPVIASGCLKPGAAWLLNVAPGLDDTFALVAAPVEVCDAGGGEAIDDGIRGWIKPAMPVADFLEQYSLHGGTHHCALSYGVERRFVEALAGALNWRCVIL
jgi:L-arabinose isomerase